MSAHPMPAALCSLKAHRHHRYPYSVLAPVGFSSNGRSPRFSHNHSDNYSRLSARSSAPSRSRWDSTRSRRLRHPPLKHAPRHRIELLDQRLVTRCGRRNQRGVEARGRRQSDMARARAEINASRATRRLALSALAVSTLMMSATCIMVGCSSRVSDHGDVA